MKYQEPECKIIIWLADDICTVSGEHSDWNDSDDNVIDGWGE